MCHLIPFTTLKSETIIHIHLIRKLMHLIRKLVHLIMKLIHSVSRIIHLIRKLLHKGAYSFNIEAQSFNQGVTFIFNCYLKMGFPSQERCSEFG